MWPGRLRGRWYAHPWRPSNDNSRPPSQRSKPSARSWVTILFLDVVGSSALSQHLDPEAISPVVDDALARGSAIVETHQGKVLQ